LRDKMLHDLTASLSDVSLNGHCTHRLPNNLNLAFAGVEDAALMMSMKDIAVSTGSACSTGRPEASYVLKALGLSKEKLHSSIRFGLGRYTTLEEAVYTVHRVIDAVRALRGLNKGSHKSLVTV